jgi:membrane-associated phospholipid phosphatase
MINHVAIKSLAVLMQKIANTTVVLHFKEKHPDTFLFIANRLSLNKFSGLPLTIFSIAIVLNLFLLFDFTEETINSKEFIAIDSFIAELLFNIRSESIARGFYFISKLCDIPAVSLIGTSLFIYFLIRKKFHFAIGILTSLLGSGLSIYLGKNIFEIDRPHQYAYYQENYFSFPSGHATISVAFYGLLFYFFIRNSSSVKTWSVLLIVASAFWILIGISRLYLCVHYFSDVIAGYILGFLWLLLSISIIEWKDYKLQNTHSYISN